MLELLYHLVGLCKLAGQFIDSRNVLITLWLNFFISGILSRFALYCLLLLFLVIGAIFWKTIDDLIELAYPLFILMYFKLFLVNFNA